jgi:hypothetical protein
MAELESDIIRDRLLSLADNERLFRINAGMGWAGKAHRRGRFIIIDNPRPLHAAPDGWPDLTGWTAITITPDMVGQTVAVFTAEEIKTGRQKIKPGSDQERFQRVITEMGGIHRVI